jgi:hypothetical protein
MAEQQEILLGNAFVSDKGNWQKGTAYETNDIVHTQDGIFRSTVDNNTTQPSASAEGWQVWLDLKQNQTAQANETARQNAEAARAKAEESRKAAESNRADAETKRKQTETDRNAHETQREEAETQRKANDTQRTADYQAIYDGLQAKSAEIDRLLVSLQQQGSVAPMASIPARIAIIEEVTVLAGATINVAPTDVQPSTANRSMIYQIYSGDALVDAAGNVKTSTAGDIIVKVIPTLASGAARIVTIHAKDAEALTDESGNVITDENDTEITC